VRTGATIVLMPDDNYFVKYPKDENNFWLNHYHGPYLLLLDKLQVPTDLQTKTIVGQWKLIHLEGQTDLDGLFDSQWPMLKIHEEGNRFSGNSGCNSFMGGMDLSGDAPIFSKAATTLMACSTMGETHFLRAFPFVDFYVIKQNQLWMYRGNDRLMIFERTE